MYSQWENFPSVLFVTGVISILQSIAWILLAIFAILTFQCAFPTPDYLSDGFIYTAIYKFYLEGDECRVEGDPPGYQNLKDVSLTKPSEVYSWVITYLITGLITLAISVSLFKYKIDETLKVKLKAWCFITGIILVMDLTLTFFFVRDFFRLQKNLTEDPKNIGKVPVVMFVLSAKGFALWLINFCLVIYYVIWFKNSPIIEKENKKGNARELIKAYDNYGFNNSSEFPSHGKGQILDTSCYDHSSPWRILENHENQRLSANSFEAVTPFNLEEYPPVPSNKHNFIINKHQKPEDEDSCCGRGLNGAVYHGHNCSRLKSELEMKLQTWRKKTEQKSSNIPDFSHDLKNFKRGPGKVDLHSEIFSEQQKMWNKSSIPPLSISKDRGPKRDPEQMLPTTRDLPDRRKRHEMVHVLDK